MDHPIRDIEVSSRYGVPLTETFMLHAQSGLSYRILVYKPQTAAPEAGYPALFALDGNSCFGSLAEAMRLQSRHPQQGLVPGMIVGIGYESDEPFVVNRRFYDYTLKGRQAGLRPDGTPWPEGGGAEAFLAFIECELKPELARRYPMDFRRQALFGHSLGGLFTLYALAEKPQSFSHYVAGSPSVWWNDYELLQRMPDLRRSLREQGLQAKLMIAAGAGEKAAILEGAFRANELLAGEAGGELEVDYHLFEGETHVSVIHPLISRMLRFVFPLQANA
ncbi:alpha/beta hydrolase [Paenibacillus protaetiae]|uniref:Alpha/beta hydrolase n=1 Tax=Paenibacillus protaetiae TaxID=2509456 RepID=A0A4V0YF69_9BACL|nr:alpha/beta hydrolase-fold protein [Paenibacillus protaetiae]QAY66671.1 alpha/beta hydrolase [Paenibacillus protaetiae]